jgi:hypothetical protein
MLFSRHVILPKDIAALLPKGRLMTEEEWRKLGVQQSRGWVHYMIHRPGISNKSTVITIIYYTSLFTFCLEPHILLFRRIKQN